MKLIMLGTGAARVTDCYNTCFVLGDANGNLLVDGGGGCGILHQLKAVGINTLDIHDIFVTHKHIDHILGIIWMMRILCTHMLGGEYNGEARIFAHAGVTELLRDLAGKLLREQEVAFIGQRLHLIPVEDGEKREILGREVTFFDIGSRKARQFGFSLLLENGEKLTCCGDEPCHEPGRPYAQGSDWLLHESYCLEEEADLFRPHEIHHGTVREACELAESLRVKNLLIYHTKDNDLPHRKERYLAEGRRYFHGNLFVPDDLEVLEL